MQRLQAPLRKVRLDQQGPLYSDAEKEIIKYYEKCKRRKEKQAKAEANLSANAVLSAKLAISEPFQGDPRLEYIRVGGRYQKFEEAGKQYERKSSHLQAAFSIQKKMFEFLSSPVANQELEVAKPIKEEEESEESVKPGNTDPPKGIISKVDLSRLNGKNSDIEEQDSKDKEQKKPQTGAPATNQSPSKSPKRTQFADPPTKALELKHLTMQKTDRLVSARTKDMTTAASTDRKTPAPLKIMTKK